MRWRFGDGLGVDLEMPRTKDRTIGKRYPTFISPWARTESVLWIHTTATTDSSPAEHVQYTVTDYTTNRRLSQDWFVVATVVIVPNVTLLAILLSECDCDQPPKRTITRSHTHTHTHRRNGVPNRARWPWVGTANPTRTGNGLSGIGTSVCRSIEIFLGNNSIKKKIGYVDNTNTLL